MYDIFYSMHKILAPLNNMQRQAVMAVNGPVLILAGAGSGKTKTLVHRIAYLIDHRQVKPQNILAVTFTNKAAQEMKSRIKKLLVGQKTEALPMMGTFHAVCAQILRQEISILDYKKNFVIYDENDSLHLIKKIVKDLNYDQQNIVPKAIAILISQAKNQLLSVSGYTKQAKESIEQITAAIYEKYQDELKAHNALDFDDLIMLVVNIFLNHPGILKKYQKIFKYILVDEYQDTNQAQYILIKLLGQAHQNICVVGDDYQSIYAWRGANLRNILNFEKDYPDTKIILLEQNYRSTKNILTAANEIIKYNVNQKEKNLWTENPAGHKITVQEVEDGAAEGEFIIRKIFDIHDNAKSNEPVYISEEESILERILKSKTFQQKKIDTQIEQEIKNKLKNTDLSQFVILYRTNAQSRALEEIFLKYSVPYRIIGGIKFYERKEIKDLIAYLRVLINPNDWVSVERIVNEPPRGLGRVSFLKIEKTCRHLNKNFCQIKNTELPELMPKAKAAFLNFQKIIQELIKKLEKSNTTQIVDLLIDKTGYRKNLELDTEQGESRLENIQEIKTVTNKYNRTIGEAGINAFLEEVSLVSDQDEIDERIKAVNLMTIHAAKGLEFANVFITGAEEGLFPHSRSLYDPEELEEERRLCYVAITRAKQKLYIIYASQRQIYGTTQINSPSRFIADLPKEVVDQA